ncbi:hypothetical protein B0A48_09431 [Cryoendolithus antarcticus]|uniref:Pet127-domain-containing protein n=1 Tax=Cryoendolithus antarcticus TaxID=1507870 RepID=A0A1V8SZL4_9PEZI|nr:hypothetical protein B0A48_09431 [Cryoendolithus antarcticus]
MYKPLAHIPPANTQGHVCLSCRRYLHVARPRRSPTPVPEHNGGGEDDLFPLNDISSDYSRQANVDLADAVPWKSERKSTLTGEGRSRPHRRAVYEYSPAYDGIADAEDVSSGRPLGAFEAWKSRSLPPRDNGIKSLLSKLEAHAGSTDKPKQEALGSSGNALVRSVKPNRGSRTKGELLEAIKNVRGEVSKQKIGATSTVFQDHAPEPDRVPIEDARRSLSVEAQLGSVVEKMIAARKAKAAQTAVEATRRTSLPVSRKASGPRKPSKAGQALKAKPPRPSRAERIAFNKAKATTPVSTTPASVELTESEMIAAGDLLAGGTVDENRHGENSDDRPVNTEAWRKSSPFPTPAVRPETASMRQPLTENRLYRPVTHPRESFDSGAGQEQPSPRQLTSTGGGQSIAAGAGRATSTSMSEHAVDTSSIKPPGRRRSGTLQFSPSLIDATTPKEFGATRILSPSAISGTASQPINRRPSNLAEKARLTNEKIKWGGVEDAPRRSSSFLASYDTLREADQVTPPAPAPRTASAAKPWGMGGGSVFQAVSSTSSSAVGAIADAVGSTPGSTIAGSSHVPSDIPAASTGQSGGFFSSLKAKFLGSAKEKSTQNNSFQTSGASKSTISTTDDGIAVTASHTDVESSKLLRKSSSSSHNPANGDTESSEGEINRLASLHSDISDAESAVAVSDIETDNSRVRRVNSSSKREEASRSGSTSDGAPSGQIESSNLDIVDAADSIVDGATSNKHTGLRVILTKPIVRETLSENRLDAARQRQAARRGQAVQSGCLTGSEPAMQAEALSATAVTGLETVSDVATEHQDDAQPVALIQDSSTEGGQTLADAMRGADFPKALERPQSSSGDSGDSGSSWPVPEDTDPDLSELEGCDHGTVDANGLEVTALDIEQPPVPKLSFGLERVLFNPGVYQLQDPHSRVYNFDPYLQNIMPVDEFDFNALKEYKTSSKDNALSDLALAYGKKYIGSTSSMTSTLGHFHYLLSNWRDLNLDMLSVNFPAPPKTFTNINRAPTAIFLKWKNGTYAIDADKEFDSGNVLMMLGKSMEKLLTLSRSDYERYRKSDPREIPTEERDAPEAFQYTTIGDFLMRSQLDAYDSRLPGTGMFDLKTRAVLPIRMDAGDYKPMLGYELTSLQGEYRSYEREYSDMLRSTMLKYMLQARMGRMDGIFLAYHNVQRIFGFQYLPMKEIDRAIHGQIHPCLGDQEFKLSLAMLNKVLEMATAKFPERSLRFHFETKPDKDRDLTALYVFAEPMDDEDIEEIQDKTKEKLAKFEQEMMGFVTEPKPDTSFPASTTTDTQPSAPEIQTDLSSSPLFAATLITVQKVNGAQVPRPKHLTTADEWSVEYLIKPMSDPTQAWASYAACKDRRRVAFEKKEEEEGEEKVVNAYFQRLRDMAREGREWRTKIDGLEAGREKIVLGIDGKEVDTEGLYGVKDAESYMAWLYGNEKA